MYRAPKATEEMYRSVRDLFVKPAMPKILPDLPKGRKPAANSNSLHAEDDRAEPERHSDLPGVQVRKGLRGHQKTRTRLVPPASGPDGGGRHLVRGGLVGTEGARGVVPERGGTAAGS
jgi:hypothetical protein